MNKKEIIINKIKEWIKIDDEINLINNKLKEYKVQKKKLSEELISIMKNNDIDCFDINENKILLNKTKIKQPINKKFLLFSLEKFFFNDKSIDTEQLSNFILDNRAIVEKENIKRK